MVWNADGRIPGQVVSMLRAWIFGFALMCNANGAFAPVAEASVAAFTEEYCSACHGYGSAEGDVDLAAIDVITLQQDPELVRQLLHVLDTREMPPEGETQPAEAERTWMLETLRPILHAAVADSRVHVRTPIRRMNRFQYNNAVVDLLELNCVVYSLPERTMRVHQDYFQPETGRMPKTVKVGNRPLGKSQMIEPRLAGVAAFPQDLRAEHGYDNRGDHLSLSPLLMEQFLKLGQSITDSPDFSPKTVGIWNRFFAPPENYADLQQAERLKTVRDRLQPFLTKAFRRPPQPRQLERYTDYVMSSLADGRDFTDVMKQIAAAAISSPRFLYLYDRQAEADDDTGLQPIDDYELASRLSFFLWGSLPDDALLALAAEGRLSQTEVLNTQIDRMLRDRKLKRFCDSFPAQWLQLDRILSSVPNRETFPDFYFSKYRLSMHMMLEPLLLFETVLIENLPITQLIDADFTYRSSLLNARYGPLGTQAKSPRNEVTALTFTRQPVTDRRTGGVITNGAVMTMTSGPDRTQPITRGAWVAAVIFNDPPEPPPADVPPLAEKPEPGEENLTLRERLAAHRERADCRGCHEQIDPLGFALETFDPVGRWREQYESGLPIDASGRLFREYEFDNVVEFKDAILAREDRFCRALAGHLLSFALARELGPVDELALDEITESVSAEEYKLQALIRQIILSKPFRTKS
nr:DUF1592 domain-containing protein [Rubinisphaera brasiliensis]